MTAPSIGARIAFRKTLTHAEQAFFTGISGNLAPLYVDAAKAKAAGLPAALSFELILGTMASTCVNRLGGPALRIAAMALEFPAPVPVGATVEVSAEIVALDPPRLRLLATQDGAGTVMTGEATMGHV